MKADGLDGELQAHRPGELRGDHAPAAHTTVLVAMAPCFVRTEDNERLAGVGTEIPSSTASSRVGAHIAESFATARRSASSRQEIALGVARRSLAASRAAWRPYKRPPVRCLRFVSRLQAPPPAWRTTGSRTMRGWRTAMPHASQPSVTARRCGSSAFGGVGDAAHTAQAANQALSPPRGTSSGLAGAARGAIPCICSARLQRPCCNADHRQRVRTYLRHDQAPPELPPSTPGSRRQTPTAAGRLDRLGHESHA
jgi:hypothetical protein